MSTLFQAKHRTPGSAVIAGSFKTNNTSDPDATLSVGDGFTVARSTTGEFDVVLDVDGAPLTAMVNMGANEDTYRVIVSSLEFEGGVATLALKVQELQAGAWVVVDSTNNQVNFLVIMTR